MSKLFPPKIDNILPAFSSKAEYVELGKLSSTQSSNPEIPYQLGIKYIYKKNNFFYKDSGKYKKDSGDLNTNRIYYEKRINLKIPYWLNPSVGEADFNFLHYTLKSATSNTELLSGKVSVGSFNQEEKCYVLNLALPSSLFTVGQYYKLQIAFQKDSDIGYYSNAGIAKHVAQPSISIDQSNLREITGIFEDGNSHEKVYSYSFNLYDEFNNLLETSDVLIHNTNNDTEEDKSVDHWEIQTYLQPDIKYNVTYAVTTTGNYYMETEPEELQYFETIAPRVGKSSLIAENNFEEGYNKIYLKREKNGSSNPRVCGNFILLRSSQKDNYKHWEKLIDFQIYDWIYEEGKANILDIYKDYLIEQGESYQYAIQAYNSKNYYSTMLVNNGGPVYSDFEDIFLYDGERQLKVRFNAKIGGFKSNVLESKIDTIGGKYPRFFRNGAVQYKEFSLTGMLSMVGDLENEFSLGEIDYRETPELTHVDTELSSYNYQKERQFKLEVLSWLTNGKEKVLKTPSEGNYIVRLMNTSLSPNETLGRMLHTFSSTAYEIADYDFKNLKSMNFIGQSQQLKKIFKRKTFTTSSQSFATLDKSSEVHINQAIVYTQPETEITYKLQGDSTSYKGTSNVFGILDLTSNLTDKGLVSISCPSGWPAHSYVDYSYLNFVKNTSAWVRVKDVDIKNPKQATYSGQGIGKSMKNYINSQSSSEIISNFPYVQIIRKSNETDPIITTGGYYCIDQLGNASGEITNLSTILPSINSSIIYRDLDDFSIGEGLKAYIISPLKKLTLNSDASGGYYYAV